MSSYLKPKNNLNSFNSTVFKSSLTDEEIESKITSLDRVIKTNDDELTFPFGFETINGGTNTGAGEQIGLFSLGSSGEGIYPHYIKTRHSASDNNAIDFYLNKNSSDSFIAAITRDGVGIGVQEPICDLNVVKTDTTDNENILAEFRLGDYTNVDDKAAIVNIRSTGTDSDAVIQFGTPSGSHRFTSANPTEGYKGAIVFEGVGSKSRQKFHVCLDDTNSNNQTGLNAYYQGDLSKSKMSVDYDGNMVVVGSTTATNYVASTTPCIVRASISSLDLPITNGDTIIWNDKSTSSTDYNDTTGIFTAPVNGIYSFSVHLIFRSNDPAPTDDNFEVRGRINNLGSSSIHNKIKVNPAIHVNREVVQSGTKTDTSNSGSITFATTFDSIPEVATSINDSTSATRIVSVRISNVSTTGFDYRIFKIEDAGSGLQIITSGSPFDYVAKGTIDGSDTDAYVSNVDWTFNEELNANDTFDFYTDSMNGTQYLENLSQLNIVLLHQLS